MNQRRRPATWLPALSTMDVRRVITVAAFTLVAIGCAIATLALTPHLVSEHRAAVRYAHAPVCGMPAASHQADCLTPTMARVSTVDVAQNRGRGQQGYHTDVTLVPPAGHGQPAVITVDPENDRTADIHIDDSLPVFIWNNHIVRYTFDDADHESSLSPTTIQSHCISAVATCAVIATAVGRCLAWAAFTRRINANHFLLGDLILLPLTLATIIVAAKHLALPLAVLAPTTILTLALSVTALPFAPWVRRPSRTRPTPPPKSAPAPHPDWDMSKRPLGQRLW